MTAPSQAPVIPDGAQTPPLAYLSRAAEALHGARSGDSTLKLTAALYSGDHWAQGAGWTGPMPATLSAAQDAPSGIIMSEIERAFLSRNIIKDIVVRHQAGIAGREPLWNVVLRASQEKNEDLPAAERERLDAYEDALTDWWEHSQAWMYIQEALRTALWSGSGTIRLYIHDSSLENLNGETRGIPAGLSLTEAMRRVSIHAPTWSQAGTIRDPDNHILGAYHHYTDLTSQPRLEIHEKTTIAGQRVSLVHTSVNAAGSLLGDTNTYPVPDLLLYEIKLDPLVTDSIRRLSRHANKTLTMGSRNIDLGGFTERTILNGQMPEGKWVEDPDATGGRRWVPTRYKVGPGVTNFVAGVALRTRNPENKMLEPTGQFATPSIIYKDPTPYDVFSATYEAAREAIFDEAKQLHVLITGDGRVNGVSRVQAVNDFVSSLEPTRMALEGAVRWLLSTMLGLGLYFTQQAQATDTRVRVQARTSAIQPSPQDVDAALKLHDAGAISEETLLGRIGVEDVEAERKARAAEGITPTLALRIAEKSVPVWIVTRALQLAFPALGITDQDVLAQKELDLATGLPPVQAPDQTTTDPTQTDAQALATADAGTLDTLE